MPATASPSVGSHLCEIAPERSFPQDWIDWPPDVFALTSIILGRTGCYREVVGRPHTRTGTYQACVEEAGRAWLEAVSMRIPGEQDQDAGLVDLLTGLICDPVLKKDNLLRDSLHTIKDLADVVSMDDLRVLAGRDARGLANAFITLHSIADEACAGFGLIGGPRKSSAFAHYVGNLLLNARGSLSSLPKHHGVVLPKMRTPQAGLTLRSMSHHLTFHQTEVEVMWRSIPWMNIQENSLNVLCVPWPHEVQPGDLQAEADTFEAVRYFDYGPKSESPREDRPAAVNARMTAIVELLKDVNRSAGRVHMLVFPEAALTYREYHELLKLLLEAHTDDDPRSRLSSVPMLVSGVAHRRNGEKLNEVRIAAFFAERWYDLSQRKHHRWRLTGRQIRQYGFEGRLSTTRNWYENIPISQRRITFLAPNGWLAVCPLICEDLAQLEPVAQVIRGVGPTVLMALLMDGPQIDQRWPARYASVLADDPGTAVLSMTSLGMLKHSRKEEDCFGTFTPSSIFALWKDEISGSRPISMPNKLGATLLTVSAEWTEELTADGRSDHQNAATFQFQGARHFPLRDPVPPRAKPQERAPTPVEDDEDEKDAIWLGKWVDIRELSAATYALDALLAMEGKNRDRVKQWLVGTPDLDEVLTPRMEEIRNLIRTAQSSPAEAGIDSQQSEWPSEGLKLAAAAVDKWFPEPQARESTFEFLSDIGTRAIAGLKDREKLPPHEDSDWLIRRVELSLPIAILSLIHSRIERLRRRKLRTHSSATGRDAVDLKRAADLMSSIEAALQPYL